MAGKKQSPCKPSSAGGRSANGFTMAYGRKRPLQVAAATATEDSSPGMLAISAERDTPLASNSETQRPAKTAGSAAGNSQPSRPATASAVLPDCAASISKKGLEKKWICASETAQSPHGLCIRLVPSGEARCERQLRQAGYVVHAQLFHHRLAIAAHGLQAQVEHKSNILAGFSFRYQAKHLHLARRERFERSALACIQVAALNTR